MTSHPSSPADSLPRLTTPTQSPPCEQDQTPPEPQRYYQRFPPEQDFDSTSSATATATATAIATATATLTATATATGDKAKSADTTAEFDFRSPAPEHVRSEPGVLDRVREVLHLQRRR